MADMGSMANSIPAVSGASAPTVDDIEMLREEVRQLRAALLVWVEADRGRGGRSALQRYGGRRLVPGSEHGIQPGLVRLAAVLADRPIG